MGKGRQALPWRGLVYLQPRWTLRSSLLGPALFLGLLHLGLHSSEKSPFFRFGEICILHFCRLETRHIHRVSRAIQVARLCQLRIAGKALPWSIRPERAIARPSTRILANGWRRLQLSLIGLGQAEELSALLFTHGRIVQRVEIGRVGHRTARLLGWGRRAMGRHQISTHIPGFARGGGRFGSVGCVVCSNWRSSRSVLRVHRVRTFLVDVVGGHQRGVKCAGLICMQGCLRTLRALIVAARYSTLLQFPWLPLIGVFWLIRRPEDGGLGHEV